MKIYQKKKVMVTGHTGFKGSWLSEWLLSLGAELSGFSIDIPTQPAHFENLSLSKKMKDIRGDIRDFSQFKNALNNEKPEIIFHLAAQPLVRASYDSPLGTFQANTMGTANVLEAVRLNSSVRAVVVITTDKCYENVDKAAGYIESDPMGGHDPYSASKGAAEIITSSYARSFFHSAGGTQICSARAGNVIGGGDWAGDRIVPDCMRAWAKKEKVTIRNPKSVRPWQHVLEPLGAYLWLGQRLLENPKGISCEGFNFGPGDDLDQTTLQLVQELEKSWSGSSHEITASQEQAKKEAHFLRLNCDKAKERMGWTPKLSFAQTAEWTASWYKAYFEDQSKAVALTKSQIQTYQKLLGSS